MDRLLDHMRKLVRVRKVGEVAGDDVEALAPRISAALARGDLAAALEAYSRLPDAARQAGRDWAKAAEARRAAGVAARGPARGCGRRASPRPRISRRGGGVFTRGASGIILTRRDARSGDAMIRLLLFLAALALAAYGLTWLAENPGEVALTWRGVEYDVSLMVALGVVAGLAILLALAWGVVRFVFRIPSLVSLAAKARRREKGYAALSRGMVAVGSGDARAASRHAAEARKHLGDEPLAKLLRAQAAQLAGDRAGAAAAFREMLDHPQTHALGLRGLHIEARRSGDHEAALEFATRAHKHAALPWAGQAVLDDRAAHGDWAGALAIVESNAAARARSTSRPPIAGAPSSRRRWRRIWRTATRRPRWRSRRRPARWRRASFPRPRFAAG